ncbi:MULTISPECIES: hypothetical protein [Amphritea]|jgi:hypothetical protein|uniref:Uncharacterized protein n=2 Tax=Amphritea TaxID=515417 RepID=A0A1H9I507_9GAMM|nr:MULTISPECIES: hypothetical protein [Amphritea]MBN0987183.1 hypothetical protein [Amphritea pacifica]MBN1008951.1 hypothetical protein [Amphritea pacifica]SEQ69602.1 hypothetical protein SAMN03080615_02433 [Amphritea atlantica]
MPENNQLDIMGLLLSEEVGDDIDELQQLNNIIFCDTDSTPLNETRKDQGELIWQTESDQFAIHAWKLKGKISLKFITKSKNNVSVERLAKIALKAILDDLKKANP